ncbi:MAG TPA: DUF2339 domain-containing protein [Acidobacteriaceae bacterium]|jgi:uncharacterized membrane protein|nr:DUF2339 domain-containing protein [Acidobacteriaceae bacterium]
MDSRESRELEAQIAALRGRVWRLEETLQDHGIALRDEGIPGAVAVAVTATAPVAIGQPGEVAVPAVVHADVPMAAQQSTVVGAVAVNDEPSLESRIGSQWFNRIGILAVLIAAAWFLKLAWDNHWIGPLGQVLIGLVAGAGLIAWSERFRTHGYHAFSYSLKAVGSGILYLSLWAAFSFYHLIDSGVAFAAMIAVTGFNGFLSWAQDAELLALFAIVGGFSTPLLVSTGENHEVALFTYLLLLDVAVLLLVALKPWSRLLCAAFAGTVFFFAAWAMQYYSSDQFGTTAFFLACFFLIFAWAPRLVRLREEGGSGASWDHLALVVAPLANAGLGFLGYYLMLDSAGSKTTAPWVAVAFAAFYLLLLRFPARGAIHGSAEATLALHLTIAVVFLTIAIPLKTQGRWMTIGWLAEGAALVWLARRIGSTLLTVLAFLCLGMGLLAVVTMSPNASLIPVFNERFGTYLFAIAVCAFVAWLAAQAVTELEPESAISWTGIAGAAGLAVNALILLAVGWEIHAYWWYMQWRGDWTLMHDYRMYAQFSYSAFFMLFGAALLTLGFWRRAAFLRWQALVLLAVAIGKVFTVDVRALSQGYRILSFLGLGALLLAVSFVYQKDWLNLRKAAH